MSKTSITNLPQIYNYLKDPELRAKESGDRLLIIENADISTASFQDLSWENIHFVNCDFQGAYQIKLAKLNNCQFTNCNFKGIIGWGVQNNVHFLRCKTFGESIITGSFSSKNVVYEQCEFSNPKGGPNHRGLVGNYGEVTFYKCSAEWFGLVGAKKLNIIECNAKNFDVLTDNVNESGVNFIRTDLTIKDSKLFGLTDMINANLTNLTILNTQYESIDLTNATFTGDFYMEQCQGGNTDALIKDGPYRITIKNCRLQPNNKEKFVFFMSGSAKEVVIDNLKIVHTDKEIEMQFGAKGGKSIVDGVEKIYPPDLAKKITLSNTSIPQFNFEYSAADYMLIKNCEFDSANFRKSRYNKLEIINTRISRQIDFTDTKVDEQNIEFIAGFKNRIELTDGSNVRLPR